MLLMLLNSITACLLKFALVRRSCDGTVAMLQGVRPAALQKVSSGELAEFIAVCIQPKGERPRARQLLKAPYFDSIREKAVRCEAAMSATTSQVR